METLAGLVLLAVLLVTFLASCAAGGLLLALVRWLIRTELHPPVPDSEGDQGR